MTSTSDPHIFSSWSVGFRFNPTDEELVCYYLRKKVMGEDLKPDIVVEMDVYAHEPWMFPWEDKLYMKQNERYYFVKREKASTNGKGKRPRRSLEGDFDGGWWKATVGEKEIRSKDFLVGYKQTLTFYSYKSKKRNRKEAVKTDWIMHEYRLAMDTFQEWVLCRIKNNAKEEEEKKDQTQQSSYVTGGVFNVGESSTNNMPLTGESLLVGESSTNNMPLTGNNMPLTGESSTNNMALTGESSTNNMPLTGNNMPLTGESSTNNMPLTGESLLVGESSTNNMPLTGNNMPLTGESSTNNMALTGESSTNNMPLTGNNMPLTGESSTNNMPLTGESLLVGESSTNNTALTGESSATTDDEFYKYLMDILTVDVDAGNLNTQY